MAVLEKWSPIRDFELVDQRMRRLFPGLTVATFSPATDIYETDEEFVVELEVPGYEQRQLQIELSHRTLTVTGSREEKTETEDKTVRLHERLEAGFERSFELPAAADTEHVKATYANGLLTLHIPKMPQTSPVSIPIGKA
jgi:HSP20 family protein